MSSQGYLARELRIVRALADAHWQIDFGPSNYPIEEIPINPQIRPGAMKQWRATVTVFEHGLLPGQLTGYEVSVIISRMPGKDRSYDTFLIDPDLEQDGGEAVDDPAG